MSGVPICPQHGAADLFVCPPVCFDADQASDGKQLWAPAVERRQIGGSAALPAKTSG